MKIGLVVASLVLIAGGAAGCGNDSDDKGADASDSTSTAEFCGGLEDFQDDLADFDLTKDLSGSIKSLKAAAKKLETVGTPDAMPDDARKGLEYTIDQFANIPDDATQEDLEKLGDDISDEDKKNSEALDAYITKECPDLGGGESPSASSVESPSASQ